MVWFILLYAFALPFFLIIAWRTHRLDHGREISNRGWMNRAAHRWHGFNVRMKAERAKPFRERWRDERQGQQDRTRDVSKRKPTTPANLDESIEVTRSVLGVVPFDELGSESAADRLRSLFEQHKAGQLTLEEYRDAILSERDDLHGAADDLRAQRSLMDEQDYEDAREQLDDDRSEIAWRLDWVEKKLRDQALYASRPEISGSGKWARFEYVDGDGEVSKRDIAHWEVSGRYVRGYDRKRKAERNFRIDRISDWVCG